MSELSQETHHKPPPPFSESLTQSCTSDVPGCLCCEYILRYTTTFSKTYRQVNPITTFVSTFSKSSTFTMAVGSPDPSDEVKPHPDGTIETILKGMEKKPDDFHMDGSTKLADIGFGKEDFDNFVT